jgi:hypothetical protein
MAEQSYQQTNWTQLGQVRAEAQYETRHLIGEDIQKIIDRCRERGISQHFIAGLELAQHTAVFGPTTPEHTSETLF